MVRERKGKERIDAYFPVELKEKIEKSVGKGNITEFLIRASETLLFAETEDAETRKTLLVGKRREFERQMSNMKAQVLAMDSEMERIKTLKEQTLIEMDSIATKISAINEQIADLDNPESPIRKEMDTPSEIPDFILKGLEERLKKKFSTGFHGENAKFEDPEWFIKIYETWMQHRVKDAQEKGYDVKKKDLYKYIREYYRVNLGN